MNNKYLGYGLIALGVGGVGYYFWSLSTIKDRAKVTNIDIDDIGLNHIRLKITVANFATVDIPFTGFYGMIMSNGIDLSDTSTQQTQSIPANGSAIITVQGSLNWLQFLSLAPDLYKKIASGKWREIIPSLQLRVKGTIYLNNINSDVDFPLI